MNYMLTWERDFFSYADSTKTSIINKDNVTPQWDDRLVNECWQFGEQVRSITVF